MRHELGRHIDVDYVNLIVRRGKVWHQGYPTKVSKPFVQEKVRTGRTKHEGIEDVWHCNEKTNHQYDDDGSNPDQGPSQNLKMSPEGHLLTCLYILVFQLIVHPDRGKEVLQSICLYLHH